MFTDDPLDSFEVESFDLDPMRIVTYKMEDASISGEGLAALMGVFFYYMDLGMEDDRA